MQTEQHLPDKAPPRILDGVKVLVVDDQPDSRTLLIMCLRQYGAIVSAAPSVAKAMDAFRHEPPDVLVSDIGMPIEDGYALIRKVRALPPCQGGGVPALALTGYVMDDDRKRALDAGFQMHIAKPIEPEELVELVARLVGRR